MISVLLFTCKLPEQNDYRAVIKLHGICHMLVIVWQSSCHRIIIKIVAELSQCRHRVDRIEKAALW